METEIKPRGNQPLQGFSSPFLEGMSEEEKHSLIERILDVFRKLFLFLFRWRGADQPQQPGAALRQGDEQRAFELAFSPMSSVPFEDLEGQARAKLPYLGSLYLSAKKIAEDREGVMSAHLGRFNEQLGAGANWPLENVRDMLTSPRNELHAQEFGKICGGIDVASKMLDEIDQARSEMAGTAAAFRLLVAHVRERGILSAVECDQFAQAFPDRTRDSGLDDPAVKAVVSGGRNPVVWQDEGDSPVLYPSIMRTPEFQQGGGRRFPVKTDSNQNQAEVVNLDSYRERETPK